jgi:propionyl-CoA carboxylase alpha chain
MIFSQDSHRQSRRKFACRVIKTARKMGIKTVAVYSEADKRCATFVNLAMKPVHIGPAAAKKSPIWLPTRSSPLASRPVREAVHIRAMASCREQRPRPRRLEKRALQFIGPKHYSIA